jgi:hypothetical protein
MRLLPRAPCFVLIFQADSNSVQTVFAVQLPLCPRTPFRHG